MLTRRSLLLACVLLSSIASVASLTTLQEALTTAFVENVQTGGWNSVFGVHGLSVGDTCSPPSTDYPYPLETPGSDLYAVLQSGKFICSYPREVKIYAPDKSLVLSTPYNQPPSGLMVVFFDALLQSLSDHYGKKITVQWITSYVNYSDALNAVVSGEASAACGYFNPGGAMKNAGGYVVPRSNALSLYNCFSYLQQPTLYSLLTPSEFPVMSWEGLVSKINQMGTNFVVCTSGYMQYGDISDICTSTINQYVVVANYACAPTGDYSFNYLQSGACDVVWGGPPLSDPDNKANKYYSFLAPSFFAAGSFFRIEDL